MQNINKRLEKWVASINEISRRRPLPLVLHGASAAAAVAPRQTPAASRPRPAGSRRGPQFLPPNAFSRAAARCRPSLNALSARRPSLSARAACAVRFSWGACEFALSRAGHGRRRGNGMETGGRRPVRAGKGNCAGQRHRFFGLFTTNQVPSHARRNPEYVESFLNRGGM